jgi:hypothetical protein
MVPAMYAIEPDVQPANAPSGAVTAVRAEMAASKLRAVTEQLFPPEPPSAVREARLLRFGKRLHLKAYPNTAAGRSQGIGGKRRHNADLAPNFVPRFSEYIADIAKPRKGWSPSQIDDRIRYVERIRPSVLRFIEGGRFDRRKYLDKLARIDSAYQMATVLEWQGISGSPTDVPALLLKTEGWWSCMEGVIDTENRFCVPGHVELRLGNSRDLLPEYDGQADAVISDPPYGVDYKGARGGIAGDKDPHAIAGWSVPLMAATLKNDRYMCLCNRLDVAPVWSDHIERTNCSVDDQLVIWDKVRASALGNTGTTLQSRYEPIIVSRRGKPCLNSWVDTYEFTHTPGLRVARDVDLWAIPVPRDRGPDAIHPTRKPVELGMRLMLNFSPSGGLVLDPFMGTGPFAVAAIRTGRQYVGIELKREYFDIAVQRVKDALAQHPEFAGLALAA